MSWEQMELGEFLTLKRGYDLPSSDRTDGEIPIVSSSGITGYHNAAKVAGPPDHEHAGTNAALPFGWTRRTLGEVLTLKRGYDLPGHEREPGPVPIVSSSGVTGFHNAAKAEAPGVVTGRYGTLGSVYLIQEDFWSLNTALYVQDFKESDPHFAFQLLTHVLRGASSAKAAVPGVNRNDLHRIEVSLPPPHLRQVFAETVQPIHGQIATLEQQSLKLSEARDILLPRLMNGEVPV